MTSLHAACSMHPEQSAFTSGLMLEHIWRSRQETEWQECEGPAAAQGWLASGQSQLLAWMDGDILQATVWAPERDVRPHASMAGQCMALRRKLMVSKLCPVWG